MADATTVLRAGEARPLFGSASIEDGTLDIQGTPTYVLRGSDGATVTSGNVDGADATAAEEVRAWKSIDTSALDPGDYAVSISITADGSDSISRTFVSKILVTLWPESSLLDRYIDRVRDLLQEANVGEDVQRLSVRDYAGALAIAVRAYSEARPRELQQDVTLSAGDWTYPLSGLATDIEPEAAWVDDFSQIRTIEYPQDAAVQERRSLSPLRFAVDERQAEWRLTYNSPSAGEIARVTWTTLHTLSHTIDTVPPRDFEAVCLFAASVAMGTHLANVAAHTNDPEIGAAVVSFRDIQSRRKDQAKIMQGDARRLWRRKVVSI